MDATHLAVDGYVDAIPAPGTSWGTACFDLIHSPADADRIGEADSPDAITHLIDTYETGGGQR
ncbi:hypothetical protein [Streptomyces chrestomyceticus]|uniref:hypothetical protein n=1 Tax=Streptomyces chrestomyceticus TaxID=68185 RepID=UPI003792EF76